MTPDDHIPHILIIDDLFGRTLKDSRNENRSNLCGQYLFKDITGDETGKGTTQRVKKPIANVVFTRGQSPQCSNVGDTVENDLNSVLKIVHSGWVNLKDSGRSRWALILLDLCFYTGRVTKESHRKTPGMPEGRPLDDSPDNYFGLRILKALQDEFPELPVIIFSSKSRDEVSEAFSRYGALGFLPRESPNGPELLEEYLWRHGLLPDETGKVIGRSLSLLVALRSARRIALNKHNCLIRGERGTGKELLANYIHEQRTKDSVSPFVVVNSSVLTPDLFASELFGINKNIATGVDQRIGLIKAANNGDMFLDEIGDMAPQVQAGLLRALEEKAIIPVGGKIPEPVNVCFLSATNKDIEEFSTSGKFRPDLLDRLREGGTAFLPPLKDRKEDIAQLVKKFVKDAEKSMPGAREKKIAPETLDLLCSHEWPGNIRELRSCIFNAVSSNPDVELLVPVHLQIENISQDIHKTVDNFTAIKKEAPNKTAQHLDEEIISRDLSVEELIDAMNHVSFESATPVQLMGKLHQFEKAYAVLIAKYLKAGLEASRQLPSENDPEGKILIHPAVKLISGNSKVSASSAADIIKRLLKINPEAVASLLENDIVIKEAYETALRLRPTKPKAKEK